jgi:prolyl-tRNA editing enzyme YbaK/EbsC (Cys-tRNA(Pro) deacylase)
MPPFGHLYGIDLFLDRDLADADEIVFPAGRHEEVDLSGLVVQGVTFSQNVREAFGTVVEEKASDPPTYLMELTG